MMWSNPISVVSAHSPPAIASHASNAVKTIAIGRVRCASVVAIQSSARRSLRRGGGNDSRQRTGALNALERREERNGIDARIRAVAFRSPP